jgi:hypothetical protein
LRIEADGPAYTPTDPNLAAYIEKTFPKYELYGPITSIANVDIPTAAPRDQNLVFVKADFTGNGLPDYAAIIRSKYHDEISFLVAFIQLEEGRFTDYKLMPTDRIYHFIYPITVGNLCALAVKNHYRTKHTFVEDKEIPDDTMALMVCKINRGDRAYLFYDKMGGCGRPYCLAVLGED